MNILNKLAKLANTLDKRGLYSEAAVIDNIIRQLAESRDSPSAMYSPYDEKLFDTGTSYGPSPESLNVSEKDPASARYMRNLKRLQQRLLLQKQRALRTQQPSAPIKQQPLKTWEPSGPRQYDAVALNTTEEK